MILLYMWAIFIVTTTAWPLLRRQGWREAQYNFEWATWGAPLLLLVSVMGLWVETFALLSAGLARLSQLTDEAMERAGTLLDRLFFWHDKK